MLIIIYHIYRFGDRKMRDFLKKSPYRAFVFRIRKNFEAGLVDLLPRRITLKEGRGYQRTHLLPKPARVFTSFSSRAGHFFSLKKFPYAVARKIVDRNPGDGSAKIDVSPKNAFFSKAPIDGERPSLPADCKGLFRSGFVRTMLFFLIIGQASSAYGAKITSVTDVKVSGSFRMSASYLLEEKQDTGATRTIVHRDNVLAVDGDTGFTKSFTAETEPSSGEADVFVEKTHTFSDGDENLPGLMQSDEQNLLSIHDGPDADEDLLWWEAEAETRLSATQAEVHSTASLSLNDEPSLQYQLDAHGSGLGESSVKLAFMVAEADSDPDCGLTGCAEGEKVSQRTVFDEKSRIRSDMFGLSRNISVLDGPDSIAVDGRDPFEQTETLPVAQTEMQADKTDGDKDGLTDYDERTLYGTDPDLPDTDRDGVTDGVEVAYWGDEVWNADPDGDEIPNLLDPDSDNDGFMDGAEIARGADPADGQSVPFVTKEWLNYTIRCTMSSFDDDAVGIMFRFQDQDNYYRFSWDSQRSYRRLVKKQNGEFTLLAEDSVPYIASQPYEIEITAGGSLLIVRVDEAVVFAVEDTSLPFGTVGLYAWSNSGSVFDDVVVNDLETGETLLSDDFNDGDAVGWLAVDEGALSGSSEWSVKDGEFTQMGNIFSLPTSADDIIKLGTYALYLAPYLTEAPLLEDEPEQ